MDSNRRVATRMAAGTGAAPGQAPPDLPSLLLDGRICYIGMPVSSAHTCFKPVCHCLVTITACLKGAQSLPLHSGDVGIPMSKGH